MINRFKQDYFGITINANSDNPEIYIRSDLPDSVQKSVLAHEKEHVKNKGGYEWQSWIAGFIASPSGWSLSVIMSLRWSRIKMYPILSAGIVMAAGFAVLYYFGD